MPIKNSRLAKPETTAMLFDIQRFSVHDGPGLRTTFFFKGCPLRCAWCHNPEGLSTQPQLLLEEEACIHCGSCVSVCPQKANFGGHINFTACTACGACAPVCPSGALKLVGRNISTRELLQTAFRDRPFYGEDGGVSFSGGEVMLQSAFLQEALALCKAAGLHTAVDTCGFVPWEQLEAILDNTDLFLYDIKAIDTALHLQGTGQNNSVILENYQKLAATGKRIWVRVPVIGGFNANRKEIERIAAFLAESGRPEQVTLMPYHRLGRNKYEMLGMPRACDRDWTVTTAEMEQFTAILNQYRLRPG